MVTNKLIEPHFLERIAKEVNCNVKQLVSADMLLSEGSTVPFIARYRKEMTDNLIDEQLEQIAKLRDYYIELADRRDTILKSIADQDKLTDDLEKAIRSAMTRQELEDLYLPYKPKRRTRAQKAKELGLEPLADALIENCHTDSLPENLALSFLDEEKGVKDIKTALAGARDILAERISDSAENRANLREKMMAEAILHSNVLIGQEEAGKAYQDYFDFSQKVSEVPSHRLLAILRGEREGFLISTISIIEDEEIEKLKNTWELQLDSPCGQQIAEATVDGYKRLLRPSITNEVRNEYQEQAEAEAIAVFRANLKDLLLLAPYGQLPVMGLDPGYRTGCKLAVVNDISRVVETNVIYPIQPNAKELEASKYIIQLINTHKIKAIAIGNGTASRETESFVKKIVETAGIENVIVAIVPETGASVYSASLIAREELPNIDVSLRGAVSIARRLQDPLAEFVKIDPKSLGIGQYQHDVNQKALAKELDIAVESVVNNVGVELNTASIALLKHVAGMTDKTAQMIIKFREDSGPIKSRKDLLSIKGIGPKTFEQAAGFIRIRNGNHPLDSTAVHPERYELVESMAKALNIQLPDLIGQHQVVSKLDFNQFIDEEKGIGQYTLEDIRNELLRPGRDPRPEFVVPKWKENVQKLEDLTIGLIMEGRVSNVANFGAFVDIGIKEDGLIHISEMSNQWIDDPRKIVQVGQVVKVKVIDIDSRRGRVALSMKALQSASEPSRGPKKKTKIKSAKNQPATINDLMAHFNQR